jgi:ribosomal protein S18 acetylase RimI-like enzyme
VTNSARFVVWPSTAADLAAWRFLAAEVEGLFGGPMADEVGWLSALGRHLDRGTALGARAGPGLPMVGGVWLSPTTHDAVSIDWLAVRSDHRRRGVGRTLVEAALEEAAGRPVRVVTFGREHPQEAEAEAAIEFYRHLGFEESTEVPPKGRRGPDGTPRQVMWRRGVS